MIQEIEQSTLDIDWFFTNNINIGFVASAGGKLPQSIAKSRDNIQILASYFRGLPPSTGVEINPKLQKYMINREINKSYLSDFIYMAERGLYCFDKTLLNEFDDYKYHLVASPVVALTISDLPKEIREIVVQTMSVTGINENGIVKLLTPTKVTKQ